MLTVNGTPAYTVPVAGEMDSAPPVVCWLAPPPPHEDSSTAVRMASALPIQVLRFEWSVTFGSPFCPCPPEGFLQKLAGYRALLKRNFQLDARGGRYGQVPAAVCAAP